MVDFEALVRLLTHGRVEFILVGGSSSDGAWLGALDPGSGGYEELLPHSVEVQVFGDRCRCLGLRRLIEVKRAAGRPRDLEAVAELEVLLEEQDKPPSQH